MDTVTTMTVFTFKNLQDQKEIDAEVIGSSIVIDEDGYSGRCDFTIRNDTLEIHTITAQPPGGGVGSILMFCASVEGMLHGATKIETLATARTAYDFYLRSGFLPRNELNDGTSVYDLSDAAGLDAFGMRILGRYMAATWEGNATTVKREVETGLQRRWSIVNIGQ